MKYLVFLFSFIFTTTTSASEEDDALAKAQADMNAEVFSKPFLAERPEEVNSYIKSMLEKNIKPPEYNGNY